jgi:exopolysaccharide biosynthesis polyprenyl glycosylphosphotransferase
MSESVIVPEEAGLPALEFVPEVKYGRAVEYTPPTERIAPAHGVARPPRERFAHRALWTRLALAGLLGCLTVVLLATQVNVWGFGLVGLSVAITTIWFVSLRRSAHFARERELGPIVAAIFGTAIGLAVVSLLNFWALDLLISTTELLVMAGCVFLLAAVFYATTSRLLDPGRRVVLLEPDNYSRHLVYELLDEGNRNFECIGIVDDYVKSMNSNGIPYLGDAGDFLEIVRRSRADLVVCPSEHRAATVDVLLAARMTSVHVLDPLGFQECALHRVESTSATPSWFASVLDIRRKSYPAPVKRGFDIVVASGVLLLTWPLLIVIPALIRLGGRGPILFKQIRVGERGQLFEILKFRTMVPDAESGHAVWASENDPRATRVGGFLRKTRMDELPQLWNVLRGEMSIVGPRPERPEFLDVLGKHVPFWNRRDLLKPGITGWAQVHFAYTADLDGAATKLSYDLYYLKHRSLALDALILLKTIGVLVSRRGAR